MVKYNYDKYGLLESKELLERNPVRYAYDINSRVTDINALKKTPFWETGFREIVEYMPNGNISDADFTYKNKDIASRQINNQYSYDNVNRLVGVSADNGSGEADPSFNLSSYGYDAVGRITRKKEGRSSNNDSYSYYTDNNRLKFAKSNSNVYYYSYDGSLVVDLNKKMVIEYDWRGMPVYFRFYSEIPPEVTTDEFGNVKVNDAYGAHHLYELMANHPTCRLLSTITMLYDASGNRVIKQESFE